jgi:hypothetical protein
MEAVPGNSAITPWAHLKLEEQILVTAHGPQKLSTYPYEGAASLKGG